MCCALGRACGWSAICVRMRGVVDRSVMHEIAVSRLDLTMSACVEITPPSQPVRTAYGSSVAMTAVLPPLAVVVVVVLREPHADRASDAMSSEAPTRITER